MRLTTLLKALRNVSSDIWIIHDFNYKMSKEANQDDWDKESIDNQTSNHLKVFYIQFLLINSFIITFIKGKKRTHK